MSWTNHGRGKQRGDRRAAAAVGLPRLAFAHHDVTAISASALLGLLLVEFDYRIPEPPESGYSSESDSSRIAGSVPTRVPHWEAVRPASWI